jgi:large subunit ribosomal protein L21
MNFAIIKTGGKQYLVKEGETLEVELLASKNAGDKIDFEVMLAANGDDVKVGKPLVKGAKVTASVVEHGKGEKVHVIKYHRKARYKRNRGHRQPFTKLNIEKISA